MVADSPHDAHKKEEEEEINLELSLGGSFCGGGNGNPNKPMRSSSVASYLPPLVREDATAVAVPLARTSSLPVESDKEWKKRKEQQNLRRLEAKRRRSEKQRLLKEEKQGSGSSQLPCSAVHRQVSESGKELSIARLLSLGGDMATEQEMKMKPDSQGGRMEYMPSVFTKGDDPNGRRVDGILYRYGRGEEVRIMCICHGSFYSPAEFIRHAGGTNVDHPLKHIVMNPSPPLL